MADLSSAQRNAINLHMRQQPWYQDWFRSRGLDPNHVQLSDSQRKELAQAATQNGMAIPDHTLIDKAGNVNIQHGWAGLPAWAKVAAIAGATVATMGAAGVFSGGAGAASAAGGGATTASVGTGATTAGIGAGTGTVAAAVGAGAAATRPWWQSLITPGIAAGANIYGARTQATANQQANAIEQQAAEQALADAREQRDYQRQQDIEQRDYGRSQYANYLTRLSPYAGVGPGATSRLSEALSGPLPAVSNDAMVRLRAPNGSEGLVPKHLVDHYVQQGAVPVA